MNNLTRLLMKNPSRGNYRITHDFSGLNITRMYSLFKSNLATINYCCKIQSTAGSLYVFYDLNGEISLNSKVSFNTTIGITELAQIIDGLEWWITDIFCQITGHSISPVPSRRSTILIEPGTNDLIYKNNRPVFKFKGLNDGYLDGLAIPELNAGNDFSLSMVADTGNSNSATTLFSSSEVSNQKVNVFMDTRTIGLNICQIRNTLNVLANNNYSSPQQGIEQRRLLQTYASEGDFSSYFQNSLQETSAVSGSFLNDIFRVGASHDGGSLFKGNYQFLAVHNTSINQTQRDSLDSKLNTFFNF